MKIQTGAIAKRALEKEYKVSLVHLPQNRISISCTSGNGRGDWNRKSFVFPKEIIIDEHFVEGIALYLGDGDFHRKEKNHTSFTSKDKDIAKHFLDFLRKYFLIRDEDITFILKYKKKNDSLRKEWGDALDVNPKKFLVYYAKRNKEEICNIQVNGAIFRRFFEFLITAVATSRVLKTKILRRAFLRGIFAAEGSIGIDREKKPYIVQIAFSTAIHEKMLHSLICQILKEEGIRSRIDYGTKDNSCDIVITNWRHYLKLWRIGTFDISNRKKENFERIARNLEIYIELSPSFRRDFFHSLRLKQKEIAKLINSWQGNVSRTQKGQILLRLEQIEILLEKSSYSKEELLLHIKNIRIGSLTKIKQNPEIFAFLKKFKLF